jgi:hypothetical protein
MTSRPSRAKAIVEIPAGATGVAGCAGAGVGMINASPVPRSDGVVVAAPTGSLAGGASAVACVFAVGNASVVPPSGIVAGAGNRPAGGAGVFRVNV